MSECRPIGRHFIIALPLAFDLHFARTRTKKKTAIEKYSRKNRYLRSRVLYDRVMKRVLLILLLSFAASASYAQRIAYGERTPRIDFDKFRWYDDIRPAPPDSAGFVYIGFIYSRSTNCLESCFGLRRSIDERHRPLQVILITREPAEMVDPRIRECLGNHIGLLLDEDGEIFRSFGVRYVPFGVVVDDWQHRAMWFGNPLTAEHDIFKYLTPSKKYIKRRNRKFRHNR